ncbi:transporter [Alcaligenes faecalis]|uniref:transporter n=1 Tax=Alcaligenes faecalis TaxID=511 RepID=UPI00364B9144
MYAILQRTALAMALSGVSAGAAFAGDPSARDWIPAPVGTNVLAVYMMGLKSHGFYDQGSRIGDSPKLNVQGMIYRQMHYRELAGKTVQYELIVPGFRNTLDVPGADRDRMTGIGDVTAGAAVWLHNDPDNRFWFAWEPFITAPTGRYHGSQADVSAGKNRWSTVQDFAIVKGFGESSFVEGVAEFEFFGNNKNYYGQTLKKDAAIRLMALVSTNLTEKTYVGLRYRYETGGREKVNGETTVTRARNHQLAAEITHQLTDAHQVQLQYIHDLKVENGPRMRGLQFRYAYAF